MADEILMDIVLTIPSVVEVAGDMPERWSDGLTVNAARINDRRLAKVPDSGAFNTKVATPSSAGFTPMIDASFVSKRGLNAANIGRKQYKNLSNSFDKWNDKLDQSFATIDGIVAKRFKDQVVNNKGAWASGMQTTTLRATGDRIRGLLAPQILSWMTAENGASALTNGITVVAGAPTDFTTTGLARAFKAAAMQKITGALITILNADFLAAEITAQNDILVALANGFEDAAFKPFVEGGGATDSLLQFEYADPTLTLHARIVQV